jgi:hypothetical protein
MTAFIPNDDILNEGTYETFMAWVERKFNGHSVRDIDRLAKRAYELNSQADKIDLLKDIDKTLKTAIDTLETEHDDEPKRDTLRDHIEVLKKIRQKATQYSVLDKFDKQDRENEEARNIKLEA